MTSSLLSLVKLGGVGASLAFLLLSYRLLWAESKRAKIRGAMLVSVLVFTLLSGFFYLAGTVAEVASGLSAEARDQLVLRVVAFIMPEKVFFRKVITDTGRDLDDRFTFNVASETIGFPGALIDSSKKGHYEFVVGARTDRDQDLMRGAYLYARGPFEIAHGQEYTIPKKVSNELGCSVEAAVFRVPKGFPSVDGKPFKPGDYHGEVAPFFSVSDGTGC